MIIKNKMLVFFISICLPIAAGGCLQDVALPLETDLPETEIMPVEIEATPIEDDTEDVSDAETASKKYDNCFGAYLDILVENGSLLTHPEHREIGDV